MRAIAQFQADRPSVLDELRFVDRDSGLMQTHDLIRERISAEPDSAHRALLEDAFAVEDARFSLLRGPLDFAQAYMDRLVRPSAGEIRESRVVIQLAERVKILEQKYDWEQWIHQKGPSVPARADAAVCVFQRGRASHSQRVSEFSSLVLRAAEKPGTSEEVFQRVMAHVQGPPLEHLRAAVFEQLEAAASGGLLRRLSAPQGAEAVPSPSSPSDLAVRHGDRTS
jgi:hypothetical protein